MRLAHFVYGLEAIPAAAARNEFEITMQLFAGVSVFWSPQRVLAQQVVFFHIQTSMFQHNVAKLGAAVHVDQFWSISQGLMATIWIEKAASLTETQITIGKKWTRATNQNRSSLDLEQCTSPPAMFGSKGMCPLQTITEARWRCLEEA